MKTYDIYFDDCNDSNNMGWGISYIECRKYIKANNGTNNGYFADYKGGAVSIYCNEDEEVVYSTLVK